MPDSLDQFNALAGASSAPAQAPAPEQPLTPYMQGTADPLAAFNALAGAPTRERRRPTSYAPESGMEFLANRSIPFVSAIGNAVRSYDVGQAQQRMSAGTASPYDQQLVQAHEEGQVRQQNQGIVGNTLGMAASIPAMVGEAMVGGAATEAAAAASPRLLGWLAPRAVQAGTGAAPSLLSVAGIRAAASGAARSAISPSAWGRNAVATTLMPSLYLHQGAEQNIAEGREAMDPRGIGSAYGMAFAQNAVLGSLGFAGNNISGRGIGATAGRNATRIITGMAEQAGLDVAASSIDHVAQSVFGHGLGLDTHFGVLGDLARGEFGQAGTHAVEQALMFGTFAALHEVQHRPGPAPIMRALADGLNAAHDQGIPLAQAAPELTRVGDMMRQMHEHGATREPMQQALDGVPELHLREYGREVMRALPENLPGQGPEPGIDRMSGEEPAPEAAPPAPEPPAAPARSPWLETYQRVAATEGPEKARRLADLLHPEGPAAHEQAALASPPEQRWQHTGTTFEPGPEGRPSFTVGEQRFTIHERPQEGGFRISVHGPDGERVAQALFDRHPDGTYSSPLIKSPKVRGVARAIYDFVHDTHGPVRPSAEGRTGAGKAFWDRNAEVAARQQPPAAAPPAVPAPREPLASWSHRQIQQEVMRRGEKGTGTREELIARLRKRVGGDEGLRDLEDPGRVAARALASRDKPPAANVLPADQVNSIFGLSLEGEQLPAAPPSPEVSPGGQIATQGPQTAPANAQARLEAMRRRQMGLAPVPVPGQPTGMEALRQRFEAGRHVPLADLMNEAGLTVAEQHVIRERLEGRSHEAIGADPALGRPDEPYSRQRIEQIERAAMAKLGVNASLAATVHAQEKADGIIDRVAQGHQVDARELHADPEVVERRGKKQAADRLDAAADLDVEALIKELEDVQRTGREPDPRIIADAERSAAESLASARAGGQDQRVPGEDASGERAQPAPVQPEASGAKLRPDSAAAGAPAEASSAEGAGNAESPRPAESGGSGNANDNRNAAAAAQRGQTDRDQLAAFVAEVKALAAQQTHGWGNDKVFIHHVEQTYRDIHPEVSSAEFRARLMGAVGELRLSRADLVQAMHAGDVAKAETVHPTGVATFHFINAEAKRRTQTAPNVEGQAVRGTPAPKPAEPKPAAPAERVALPPEQPGELVARTSRGGKKLTPPQIAWEKRAVAEGMPPDYLHRHAADIRAADAENIADAARLRKEVLEAHPELRQLARRARHGDLDFTMVPGFDEIARTVPNDLRHVLGTTDEHGTFHQSAEREAQERLFDLLSNPAPKPMKVDAAYQQALHELHQMGAGTAATDIAEARRELKETGLSDSEAASDIAEAQARTEHESRHQSPEADAVQSGHAVHEAAGDEAAASAPVHDDGRGYPADWDEPLPGDNRVPGSEPGAGPGQPVRPGEPGGVRDRASELAREFLADEGGYLDIDRMRELGASVYGHLKDSVTAVHASFRKLAGEIGPRTTDLSRTIGEKMARFIAAPGFAREATPYYIDKVMGRGATPEQRIEWGAALHQMRFEHMRDHWTQEAARQDALHQAAVRAGDQAAAQKATDAASDARKSAMEVTSAIGPDSPLKTQADFQRVAASPEFKAMLERWRTFFVPEMESQFRRAMGLEDTDPINSPTQLPGLPFNMKAIREGDQVGPGTIFTGAVRGNLANVKSKRFGFAQTATGAAEGYHMDLGDVIQNSLAHGAKRAAKADMERSIVAEGHGRWGPPGQRQEVNGAPAVEIPNVRPPRGTQEAGPHQTSLYVDARIAGELRQAYQVDAPFPTIPGTGLLAKAALLSTVEAGYHAKNLATMFIKPGVTWNPARLLKTALGVMAKDTNTMARIVELARIGAAKDHPQAPGMFGGGALDPTAWGSHVLRVVDQTMRLTMDEAFNTLRRQGRVEGSETNRRNFVNQLGQYNRAAQHKAIVWLRDSGIGPFATAGSNFNIQGLRALTMNPGVKATSAGHAVGLRAEMLARVAAVLAIAPIVNYFTSGRLDGDDSTPLGAIRLGSSNGRTHYLDLASMTGITRGARMTGVMALAEGHRSGASAPAIVDKATEQTLMSILHPTIGPAASFGHTMFTGRNSIGQQLTPRHPAPDDSVAWARFRAALLNANPLVASATGANRPGQNVPASERATQLLGPYAPRSRTTMSHAQRNAMEERRRLGFR